MSLAALGGCHGNTPSKGAAATIPPKAAGGQMTAPSTGPDEAPVVIIVFEDYQ